VKLAKLVAGTLLAFAAISAQADTTPFDLASGNLSQAWSNAALIRVNDDWSAVPSVITRRGDGLTAATAVDPQTEIALSRRSGLAWKCPAAHRAKAVGR